MRTFVPLISGAFAAMDLSMTANTQTTMDLEWSCAEDAGYTLTYQMLRPDNGAADHPDFDEQKMNVTGAGNDAQLTGLNGPFEYAVEVCSETVNSTCGCSSGKFRTAGTAVYVNSIEHFDNGTAGGKILYGAYFFDDAAACVSAGELTFGTCNVTVEVYQAASDPAVRQYAGTGSNQVKVAVSAAYRGNFVTFKAEFESTVDACWDGVLAPGNNPGLDNDGANATDYRGAPANAQDIISAAAIDAADVTTERTSDVELLVMLAEDILDEFGNNVTDDNGVDTGIPMQNQTNFALQGNLANATTPLNEANVACDFDVVFQLSGSCTGVQDVEGSLAFTDNLDATFSAKSTPGNNVFFMSGKIPAPDVLLGCDDIDASASVTLTSFN